jgi:hypothetical protein
MPRPTELVTKYPVIDMKSLKANGCMLRISEPFHCLFIIQRSYQYHLCHLISLQLITYHTSYYEMCPKRTAQFEALPQLPRSAKTSFALNVQLEDLTSNKPVSCRAFPKTQNCSMTWGTEVTFIQYIQKKETLTALVDRPVFGAL